MPMNAHGLWARGRSIEYCVAMAVHKRLQDSYRAVMVLSGCIAGFRTNALRDVGGFRDRTVGEDMDATWTLHVAHYRLGYIPKAVAYTLEPPTWAMYKGQMRRWSAAFFQTLALHKGNMHRRPALAFLAAAALFDIVSAPVALVGVPIMFALGIIPVSMSLVLFSGGFALAGALIATHYIGVRRTIAAFPGFLILSVTNLYFFTEAIVREWFMGRAQTEWAQGH